MMGNGAGVDVIDMQRFEFRRCLPHRRKEIFEGRRIRFRKLVAAGCSIGQEIRLTPQTEMTGTCLVQSGDFGGDACHAAMPGCAIQILSAEPTPARHRP